MKKRISMCLVFGMVILSAGSVWGFTEGADNNFFGEHAGEFTTGGLNSFFGGTAGFNNRDGSNNSFFGYGAGATHTVGGMNSFFGAGAGGSYVGGEYNSFFGFEAGAGNISGSYGNANSFFGYQAGYANTTGRNNSFFGRMAGDHNTEGNYNSFFGNWAGRNNITGSNNVFLGFKAGYYETGSNKLYISNTDTSNPLIYGEFDNQYLMIYGTLNATLVSLSDMRFKKGIMPLKASLKKINSLKGVSYEWKTEEYSEKGFQKGRQIGLIAQDVEKVLPELVYTDSKGYKAVAYDKLIPVLVEAMKEQQKMIQEERKARQELQKTVEKQQTIIGELQTALQFKEDKDVNVAQKE